jgi:signal transduction histidine kinase
MSAALDAKGAPGGAEACPGGQGLEPVDLPDVFQVDVVQSVRCALGLLASTRRLHGVEVALELPDGPVPARVSRRRLEQVLLLLVAHAVDAAAPGAVCVRVVVEPPDDFGDVGPRFQVVMPPPRVDSPQRRLARARELVEAMGGELSLEPQEAGTTVCVQLPAPGFASF